MEVSRLLGNSLGRAAFAATLAARTEGPIARAKATLAWAGLELRGTTLWSLGDGEGICVLDSTKHRLLGFVLKAIRARDLSRASKRSPPCCHQPNSLE